MAWADIVTKLAQLDAETYSDNSQGTTASEKLLTHHGYTSVNEITDEATRERFEQAVDYVLGAVINLRNSKALPIDTLRRV